MQENTVLGDYFVLIEQVVVAHRFCYDTSAIYRCPEGRKTYGLVHLITGTLDYRFENGHTLLAHAGDTLLLRPRDAYRVTCPETCEHYTVNFLIREDVMEGDIARQTLQGAAPVLHRESDAYREDLFADICTVFREKQPGYRMRAVSLTYRLLFDFLRKQQPADAGAALVLAPARAYLEAHWNQTVTLSDLARLCHLSVSYFRHLFLRFYGICPLRYRDSLRLLHARDYLLTETWPIAEIARRCGFHDANYFSRFFRQRMGISPSDYRTAGQFA